ncbi:MAG: valine--tRNA ligase [Patescibacteria group bacterium]|nr:valine--tRNA ligase [Patescibacteria group bacterium]
MNITLDLVNQVRRFKSESQISMGAELSKIVISCSEDEKQAISQFIDDVKGVTKSEDIEWKDGTLSVECFVKA